MIVSTTIASVIELFGRLTEPVAKRFVVVTFVLVKFVPVRLVIAPVVAMNEVANKLVEVAFVNMPAAGVTRPIGVLLIVPPSIVRPFTTNASVTEFVGRESAPDTSKFVVVTFSAMSCI